jgi:hypothetical protein
MRNKNAKSKNKNKLKIRKSKKKVIRGGAVTNPMLKNAVVKNAAGANAVVKNAAVTNPNVVKNAVVKNAVVTNQQTEPEMTKEEALAIMADIKKSLEYKLSGLWYGSNPYSGLKYEYQKNMNKYFERSGSYDLLDKIYHKNGSDENIREVMKKDREVNKLCTFLYIARFFFISLGKKYKGEAGEEYKGAAGLLQAFYETINIPSKYTRDEKEDIQSGLIENAKKLNALLQDKLNDEVKPKSSMLSSFFKKKPVNQPLTQPVNQPLTQPVNKYNKVIIARPYVPFDEKKQSQQASPVAPPPVVSTNSPVASTNSQNNLQSNNSNKGIKPNSPLIV